MSETMNMGSENTYVLPQPPLPDPKARASLAARMAKVMGGVKRIRKSGRNEHFHYDYATSEDVADLVREQLAEHGVAFGCDMVDLKQQPPRTLIKFRMSFTCSTTGGREEFDWYAEAIDKQDKGINKAATSAVKYFLLKTFLVATGDPADDPDSQGPVGDSKKSTKRSGGSRKAGKKKADPMQDEVVRRSLGSGHEALAKRILAVGLDDPSEPSTATEVATLVEAMCDGDSSAAKDLWKQAGCTPGAGKAPTGQQLRDVVLLVKEWARG